MVRRALSYLLRASELPSYVYVILAVLAVAIGFVKDEYAVYLGQGGALWFSRAAFVVGLLSLVPIIVKDLNLWRFLPPKYHGLDPLVGRIDTEGGLEGAAFVGTDGVVRLDCRLAVEKLMPTAENIEFVGGDVALARESGRINAAAFSGTRFGLGIEDKETRNREIARKNPFTFAILKHEGANIGLAATIPLTEIAATLYLQGTLSDNELRAANVAQVGEPEGCIVLFLVAHDPEAVTYKNGTPTVLRELMRVCLLQVAVLASLTPSQTRFHVVAANSNKTMQKLFKSIGLDHHAAYRSADGQDVFAADVRVRSVLSEAELRQIPAFARQLAWLDECNS